MNPLPSEINRAVELKYKGLGAFVQQAQDLLDKGEYQAAQRKAEEAVLAYDDPPSVQRVLGEALLRQGQSSEALKAFKRVNSSQNDSASYARIGLLRLRLGDVAGSRAMLKDELVIGSLSPKALDALPAVRDARTLEGAWLFAIGLMDDIQASDADAAFYYNQALGVFPRTPCSTTTWARCIFGRDATNWRRTRSRSRGTMARAILKIRQHGSSIPPTVCRRLRPQHPKSHRYVPALLISQPSERHDRGGDYRSAAITRAAMAAEPKGGMR